MLTTSVIPARLRHIPSPPQKIYCRGEPLDNLLASPCVAIVGSRKVTAYGKAVTHKLAYELARAGVVIISGLALGVDSIAHRAALEAKGKTIAVLPGSLDTIHPSSHNQLATQILREGGALVSEYPAGIPTQKWNFIQRNRLVSGLSDAVLITEATQKSGTLHTASFALDQGRTVLAVPGNITSAASEGTNNLIKTGAQVITGTEDILHILGIQPAQAARRAPISDNPHEQTILTLLHRGVSDGSHLYAQSGLEVAIFNQTLTMLEIQGCVRSLGANQWALS